MRATAEAETSGRCAGAAAGAGLAACGGAAAASCAAAQHVAAVLLPAPGLPSALPPPARASLAALRHLRPCLAALRRLCDPALGCAPDPAPEGPAQGGAAGGAAWAPMGASGGARAPRLTWSDCVWALGNVLTLVVGERAMRVVRVASYHIVVYLRVMLPYSSEHGGRRVRDARDAHIMTLPYHASSPYYWQPSAPACAGRASRAAATRQLTRAAARRQVRDGREVRFLARSPLLDPAAAPGFADELVATAAALLTAARARLRGPHVNPVPRAEAAAAAAGACGARAALWPLSEGTLLAQLLAAAAGDAGLARLAALLHLALDALPELAGAASLSPAAGREVRPAERARPPALPRTRRAPAHGRLHHTKWFWVNQVAENVWTLRCPLGCSAQRGEPMAAAYGAASSRSDSRRRARCGPARLPSPRGCPRRPRLRARRAGAQAAAS
jgi:hypothetical protein